MTVSASPFGLKFGEAIDYLKGKLPEASLAWNDLAGPVHAKVFTVAGATSADLAADIHGALVRALDEGQTITTFRKAFDKIVQARGWQYKGSRGWRTSIIFDTNMRSATMAGRWAQIQANKADFPYLQYRTAGDARVRPQHRAWNGLIYPVDDAFWSTHYPPNGWGCRCTVRAYSRGDLQGRGLKVSEPMPIKQRTVTTQDGDLADLVPEGIDPGWDHNVGQSWITPELALGQKLARLPAELRGPVVDKTISPAVQTAISDNWKAFKKAVKDTGKPSGEAQILGFLDSATMQGLADQVPTLELQSTAVAAFDKSTNHLAGNHKRSANSAKAWPEEMNDSLPQELRSYQAVLWDTEGEVLVVVPSGTMNGGRLGKIVLRPNVQTKFGAALQVVSLGAVQVRNLTEAKYRVLVGRLPTTSK